MFGYPLRPFVIARPGCTCIGDEWEDARSFSLAKSELSCMNWKPNVKLVSPWYLIPLPEESYKVIRAGLPLNPIRCRRQNAILGKIELAVKSGWKASVWGTPSSSPSASFENLLTLKRSRHHTLSLVAFSLLEDFLIKTESYSKRSFSFREVAREKALIKGQTSMGAIFSCELRRIFLFPLRIFCTFCRLWSWPRIWPSWLLSSSPWVSPPFLT